MNQRRVVVTGMGLLPLGSGVELSGSAGWLGVWDCQLARSGGR